MGSDKALMKVDGITLLEKSIALCYKVCDAVILSSNHEIHQKYACPVFADERKNTGPMGGISTCLKKSKNAWNLIISVDAAFVETDFVNFLISEIDNYDALVPVHSKGKEPLIALYNKNCLAKMEEMIERGDFKMHNLLHSLKTKYVDSQHWIEKYPKLFHNLNRPEDL